MVRCVDMCDPNYDTCGVAACTDDKPNDGGGQNPDSTCTADLGGADHAPVCDDNGSADASNGNGRCVGCKRTGSYPSSPPHAGCGGDYPVCDGFRCLPAAWGSFQRACTIGPCNCQYRRSPYQVLAPPLCARGQQV